MVLMISSVFVNILLEIMTIDLGNVKILNAKDAVVLTLLGVVRAV